MLTFFLFSGYAHVLIVNLPLSTAAQFENYKVLFTCIKWFQLLPDFSFSKFVERKFSLFEKICDFIESVEKGRKLVKWKSNQV